MGYVKLRINGQTISDENPNSSRIIEQTIMDQKMNNMNDYSNEGVTIDPGRSSAFIRFKKNKDADVYGMRVSTNQKQSNNHYGNLINLNQSNYASNLEVSTMF